MSALYRTRALNSVIIIFSLLVKLHEQVKERIPPMCVCVGGGVEKIVCGSVVEHLQMSLLKLSHHQEK